MPLPAFTEVKEGKLTIRNLQPVDSGLYQCVATNSLGTKKATMNLFEQRRPEGLYSARYADLIFHDKTFCWKISTSSCLKSTLAKLKLTDVFNRLRCP